MVTWTSCRDMSSGERRVKLVRPLSRHQQLCRRHVFGSREGSSLHQSSCAEPECNTGKTIPGSQTQCAAPSKFGHYTQPIAPKLFCVLPSLWQAGAVLCFSKTASRNLSVMAGPSCAEREWARTPPRISPFWHVCNDEYTAPPNVSMVLSDQA
jgi:hypothetical protein